MFLPVPEISFLFLPVPEISFLFLPVPVSVHGPITEENELPSPL